MKQEARHLKNLPNDGRLTATAPETLTSTGEARGYVDFRGLRQLWLHTGTLCNLRCPDCFEGSGPGDRRLQALTAAELLPHLRAALSAGVENFGITGGEPFMNPHCMSILHAALELAPCLLLSNGTTPMQRKLNELDDIAQQIREGGLRPLTVRISLDFPDAAMHDAQRGEGAFASAVHGMQALRELGLPVHVARRIQAGEDPAAVTAAYAALFASNGLPENIPVTAFPNLQCRNVPEITTACMTTYHTEESRAAFMCASSRMLVKQHGALHYYACTLVDDDPAFDFGLSFPAALARRTFLSHRRCFACFSQGVACGG